mmetsp:Transcript_30177/g.51868  ORF Transcript_30177/g.51868 Transcript_30177/m.51868 type:complete len:193 (+) Transcript_30177:516-1094(+)
MRVRKLGLHDVGAAAIWVLGLAFPVGHEEGKHSNGGNGHGDDGGGSSNRGGSEGGVSEGGVDAGARADARTGGALSGVASAVGSLGSLTSSLGVSFTTGRGHDDAVAMAEDALEDPPALVLMRVLALPLVLAALLFVLATISLIGSVLVATAGVASFSAVSISALAGVWCWVTWKGLDIGMALGVLKPRGPR